MTYMERGVLRDIHTGAQFNTQLKPRNTRMPDRGSHADTRRSCTHKLTNTYSGTHQNSRKHKRGIFPEENPEP